MALLRMAWRTSAARTLASPLLLLAFLIGARPALPQPTQPEAREPAAADAPVRELGEVTVTATRSERGVLEVPGNVTVIDREAIERSGASHVAELLRREAGVFVTQSAPNPTGYSVEARGFNNGSGVGSSFLVLVDGRRVNEPDSSVVDWAQMHLDYVERIEVVRGPASALYGDNAVGGTIQIFTRSPEGPLRATLHGRTGSYDLDGGSLVASGSQGPLGFSLFAEGFGLDGFRERSDFRARDFEAKLRVAAGEHAEATLVAGYSSDDRKRPGSLSALEMKELGRDAADPRVSGDFARVRQSFVQGSFEVAPRADVRLKLLPFYRRRDERAAVTDVVFGSTRFHTETDAVGLNTQAQFDGSLAGRPSRLLTGIDLLREDLDSVIEGFGVFRRRGRRELFAAFVQEELNLREDLLLSAGVRFDRSRYRLEDRLDDARPDRTRPDYDVWSPKAALTYLVSERSSLYGSYSRGFRFPNFDETSGVFGANPRIRPQKSHSYEVGFKHRSERLAANLAIYHMDVDDEILLNSAVVLDFGSGPLLGVRNVNMDRVRHRGLELGLSLRPVPWLEIYGTYTLDDAKILRDSLTRLEGNRVPVTPRHRGNLGVLVSLPFAFEAGMSATWVGSRFAVNDFGNDLPKLPKYSVYDCRVAFRPRLREHVDLAFAFTVHNLFDREYEELGGRRSFVPLEEDAELRFFPSPERNYELAVSVTVRR